MNITFSGRDQLGNARFQITDLTQDEANRVMNRPDSFSFPAGLTPGGQSLEAALPQPCALLFRRNSIEETLGRPSQPAQRPTPKQKGTLPDN